LDPAAPAPIDTIGRGSLSDDYGFPPELARNIAAESKNGPYGSPEAFLARMKSRYSAFSRPVDFEALYWGQVQGLMAQHKLVF
jgi:hypothetical protein